MKRARSAVRRSLFALCVLLAACGGASTAAPSPARAPVDPAAAALVRQILHDSATSQERRALIEGRPELGVALLREFVRDLQPDTEEEYRRIPWIWRTAITAAARNDADELRRILDLSLPRVKEPLADWQAVVVGGGIVDGLSRVGVWPADRVGEILRGNRSLEERWLRAIELAAAMADDATVPNPTRFDALIMVAMQPWERSGAQLQRYLAAGVEDELQRGAVVGLAATRAPHVPGVLLSSLPNLSDRGRTAVLTGMLRTDDRVAALLDAVAAGRVTAAQLGPERIATLKGRADAALRDRARLLFPD